jgi:uncharacterized repeat protein (TIGR03803 family)
MGRIRFGKIASMIALFCMAAAATHAQTLTTIYTFTTNDGDAQTSTLVLGRDGNFYGVTSLGGTSAYTCPWTGGCGTVFKITSEGQVTTLYNFCSELDCSDGALPNGPLVEGADGNFYGTAGLGGRDCQPKGNGHNCGTVFRVTSAGELTTLYRFCSQTKCADGKIPEAGLVVDADGNFYGTTNEGGVNCVQAEGCGTVFKITPQGALTTLYSFCSEKNCVDGRAPQASLLLASNGNFYGTTFNGGSHGIGIGGSGTVFEITPAGKETVIYSFCSQAHCADGWEPAAGLTEATNGKLYGTTAAGDVSYSNGGTIFEITTAGEFTRLYEFCSKANCADGSYPAAGLVQASDGNLYGTTILGGTNTCVTLGCGTIFRISPAGKFASVYDFCSLAGCADGSSPSTALVQGPKGLLYGTTPSTVYQLSMNF